MPYKEDSIYIDPSLPFSESLANVPADFKAFLKRAFSALAELTAAGKTSELVRQVSSEEGTTGRLAQSAAKEIASQLGIEVDRVFPLYSAATFCAATFVNQKVLTPEEFVSTGVRLDFIAEADSPNVLLLAEAIAANRTSMTHTNKKNRLVHALLPSLLSCRTIVDLRPSFAEDNCTIRFAVPVIVAHITNDSTDDVWVQMSKKQVERLISDMRDVLRKVEVIEQWAAKQPYQDSAND